MDDKSGKDQRNLSETIYCFLFHWEDFLSKPNRESVHGLFWEVELPGCGGSAVPAAMAPGAVPLLPNLNHTRLGGIFETEDGHCRFSCQRKLLERMFQPKDNSWGQTSRQGPWAILLLWFGWWRTQQSTRTGPCAIGWSHSTCSFMKEEAWICAFPESLWDRPHQALSTSESSRVGCQEKHPKCLRWSTTSEKC